MNRLGAIPQPARQHHHREPTREVAHHEPALSAVPDDQARAELERRAARPPQRLADLETALKVVRGWPRGLDGAQVDDAAHARRTGRGVERLGRAHLALRVAAALVDAVHQVKRRVAAGERRAEGLGRVYVEPPPLVRGLPLAAALRIAGSRSALRGPQRAAADESAASGQQYPQGAAHDSAPLGSG